MRALGPQIGQIPHTFFRIEMDRSGRLRIKTDRENAAIAEGYERFWINSDTLGSVRIRASGGRGGIRTHGGLAPTPVFKTGALNHSATLPTTALQRTRGYDRVSERSSYPVRFAVSSAVTPQVRSTGAFNLILSRICHRSGKLRPSSCAPLGGEGALGRA